MSKRQMQTTNLIEDAHLKSNPFTVPHGYFDLLPQQVSQKIPPISTHKPRRIYLTQLALAASFALLIGLGYGIMHIITPPLIDQELADTDHVSVFRTYTLLQNDEWDEPLDSEQIITFLTEHGISPHTIAALE